ncbi:MAG: type I restriction enzyme S subunit [Colwellia sp.]|jgi:type I restriction enzyme S subunit
MNIDKSDWVKTKLGVVATEYSKRINDPSNSEFDRFVGSNNIGQWDFTIKSWETTDSVSSAMKIFEENDYLLVRRSLYASDFRERAPRANFSGICSGDIITIKENSEYLIDGFLIVILNSPQLWKFIVANASGSITRRIKWKDLSNYEFLLPPRKEQSKISNLFWSKHDCITLNEELKNKAVRLKNVIQRKFFEGKVISKLAIGNVANVYSGGTPNRKEPSYWGDDIPWIKTGEVNYGTIMDTEESISHLGLKKSSARLIPKNSVLVAMYGQGVTRGRVALTGVEATCNQASAIIVPKDLFLSEFIFYYLEFKYEELRSLAHGANQQNLNLQMIKSFEIPDFSIDMQSEVVGELHHVSQCIRSINEKIKSSETLKENLLRQVY